MQSQRKSKHLTLNATKEGSHCTRKVFAIRNISFLHCTTSYRAVSITLVFLTFNLPSTPPVIITLSGTNLQFLTWAGSGESLDENIV